MIEIDGSVGGGQVLRTSLSLSVITKKPFKITNIRIKKPNPGLQPQHLIAVNSIAKICNAQVKGNKLNSTELEFIPNEVIPGNYNFDIGTAGSTTLVLQTLLPALIFADQPSTLELIGGTANLWAPPALDIKNVFLWHLENLGINIDLEIIKEGFFPKGGGIIKVKINPIKEFKLVKQNNPEETEVVAVCSKYLESNKVAERMINGFESIFKKQIKTKIEYVGALSIGCYIHANYTNKNIKLGMSIIGEKSKKAEDVGKECAIKLLNEINSEVTVDSFTADQLLIYLALKGSEEMKVLEITDHIKTNLETIKLFLDIDYEIKDNIISLHKLV